MTRDQQDLRLAVLIDADNTSPRHAREMVEELARYGVLTVRRAYGDWTTPNLGGWKDKLLEHAIQPMQQFANTKGKNSTDSALIIDAMDLLYAGNLDGFVIVSSDADFTRLATRLRESGMTVYGLGQRKTPQPFVEACDKFIYLEVLGSGPAVDEEADETPTTREPDGALHSLITRSLNKSNADDEDWTTLSALGNVLTRSDPSFDPRTYGKQKLGDLVRVLPYVETRTRGEGGSSQLLVRIKGSKPAKKAAPKTAKKAAAGTKADKKSTSAKPARD